MSVANMSKVGPRFEAYESNVSIIKKLVAGAGSVAFDGASIVVNIAAVTGQRASDLAKTVMDAIRSHFSGIHVSMETFNGNSAARIYIHQDELNKEYVSLWQLLKHPKFWLLCFVVWLLGFLVKRSF
jgi:hypothetical protein